jgi:putative sigma-54 modulation protein
MSRKSKAAEFVEEGYNIAVTGRNVQVTESMKDYAIEKVSKIERFIERIIDVNIIMDVQKLEHRVDLTLKFNNVKIKAQAISDNMYASIDMAVHKLEKQLLKYKARLHDHHVKNHAVDMNVNIFAAPSDAEEFNDEIENANHSYLHSSFTPAKVISQENRPLRTLTVDEAMVKIELSGDQFLVFRSEEDRKIKVIYRRSDGNFGVIEVEA